MILNAFSYVCLLMGFSLALAAVPELSPKERACRQAGQANAAGQLACNADLPCDQVLETCRPVTYRQTVQGNSLKYCSCDTDARGDDPQADPVCMMYVVESPTGFVRQCLTAGTCGSQSCRVTDPSLAFQTCSCQ